jgi:hypothetical protein
MTTFFEQIRDALRPMIEQAVSQIQAESSPQKVIDPPPTSAKGLDLKPSDQLKAADLRIAFLMGKIPEDTGLLIDAKALSKLLDIAKATLDRLICLSRQRVFTHLGRLDTATVCGRRRHPGSSS